MKKAEIVAALRANGITFWELAQQAGVGESTIYRWFRTDPVKNEAVILNAIDDITGCTRPWANCYEYRRILEILEDYWISCKDEALVRVDMHFEKENGESQSKHITWKKPNFRKDPDGKTS